MTRNLETTASCEEWNILRSWASSLSHTSCLNTRLREKPCIFFYHLPVGQNKKFDTVTSCYFHLKTQPFLRNSDSKSPPPSPSSSYEPLACRPIYLWRTFSSRLQDSPFISSSRPLFRFTYSSMQLFCKRVLHPPTPPIRTLFSSTTISFRRWNSAAKLTWQSNRYPRWDTVWTPPSHPSLPLWNISTMPL